jgi:hypothetical protein
MKCFFCNNEFEIKDKRGGGQNRIFCYDCVPSFDSSNGHSVNENRVARHAIVRTLFRTKADNEKKALGCSVCGYNKYGGVLEWHHIEPHTKEKSPSDYLRDGSMLAWNRYKAETEKCILLCANCHREWHIEHADK